MRELDFFSEGIGLTIEGEERAKSKTGVLMTVLIYLTMIAASAYYISKFVSTADPDIQYNIQVEDEALTFDLSRADFQFFLLIMNPEMSATSVSASGKSVIKTLDSRFLDIQTVKKYYKHFAYINTTQYYEASDSQSEQIVNVKKTPVNLISCRDATWLKEEKYATALKADPYGYDAISNYGVCVDVPPNTKVYGDSFSKTSVKLIYQLDICEGSDDGCFPDALDRIQKNGERSQIVTGFLEAAIDNSQKRDPWTFGLNLENTVQLNPSMASDFRVVLKQLTAETDMGLIIEDKQQDARAAIYQVNKDFVSRLTSHGDVISIGGSTANDVYYTLMAPVPMFMMEIESSRITEAFSRSYMTILDLFGNIGGSVDFTILILLTLFCWYESRVISRKLRGVIVKHFGLPTDMKPKTLMDICCRCRKKRLQGELRPWSEDHYKAKMEALDEVAAEVLSFENLSDDSIVFNLAKDVILPQELSKMAPAVAVMEKMVKEKEDEEAKKNKIKVDPNANNRMTVGEAYRRLVELEQTHRLDEDPLFAKTREQFLATIREACDHMGVLPEEYFGVELPEEEVSEWDSQQDPWDSPEPAVPRHPSNAQNAPSGSFAPDLSRGDDLKL